MHGLLSAFLALGAFQALTATAQDPACLANCASQVRADFTKFSCANADDAGCLCVNADFKNGVRDCATPCGSTDGDVDTFLNDGFCLAIAPPAEAPSSEAAPQPESTQPPAPESTAAPETSAAPEPTTVPEPEEEPQPTPVPETTTEELAQDTTTEPVQPETTAAPESTSAVAKTESSTTLSTRTRSASNAGETTGANEDEEKEGDKKDDEDEGGLSQTAIIGIGVGAGAAGLAAVGLLVWLCLRKRNKQDARPFIEISKPMPASGAGDYTGRRDPFAEKRGDVIEMQSNRYEDMLPRQEPRTVV